MILKLIGIRDKVSMNFEGVNVETNEFTAKRNFGFAVNNSKELLYKAKDLELYVLGDFDSQSGKIDIISPMIRICAGDEVINNE